MKMRRPHRISLAPRVVALLRELHGITGNGRFVFLSNRSRERCMSENTVNAALRRLGFAKDKMTAHGFRSAALTAAQRDRALPATAQDDRRICASAATRC
jgi:integrase